MNKQNIRLIFYILIIINQLFQTIVASQYTPGAYFTKPLNDDPYISNTALIFSAGFANEAFDMNSKSVPFLQQYGTEDFLQRFVNPSLGPDNLESAGQGLISGKYHFKQFRFSYEKNIYHQLYFGITTTLQDLNITDITPEFIPSEYPLSTDQITYLNALEHTIPKNIHQYGMNSTNIYCGYNESIEDFSHIDSLNVLILIGISTPQWMQNDNKTIFQYDCSANYHFGYPVLGAVSANIKWVELGIIGLVEPYQPSYTIIPINRTGENNHLLFSQLTQAKIEQSPYFSGVIYLEMEHTASGISGTIGYEYSQYLDSTIIPIDRVQFPQAHANTSILLDGYSVGSLLLQIDIDCTSDDITVAPIVSLFFTMPIAGNLYPKQYTFGGACNLEIDFSF